MEQMMATAVDADMKWMFRLGGVSAVVLGLAYIAIIPLYAHVGAPPTGGEAWLNYLPGKTTVWWAILALSVLTDFLFAPVAISLYFALEKVNRGAVLIGTAFVGLFVVLDLAITWSHIASLLILSGDYAAATNGAQRAAYVAAANYAGAVLASRLEVVYAIVTLSLGILIISLVTLKGMFSKTTAYLGLITGVLGITAITRLNAFIIMNALFATIWVFFVGYRLFRLGQR